MNKSALKTATLFPILVSGGFSVALFLVLYISGLYLFDSSFNWDLWIPLPFIFIAIWYYRKANGNELRFWQGLVLGFLINFGTLVVLCLFLLVFFELIDTEFLEQSKTHALETISKTKETFVKNHGDEDIKRYMEQYKFIVEMIPTTTLWDIMVDKILRYSGASTFFSLILSLILRK